MLAGAWVAVVLLFWLGLFVPAMRPGIFRPEAVDLYGYFFPKFVYGSAELERGALPLWNPYEYAGVPFLGAAQPAVLYPPRVLLFALLPPTAALHVFMVVHYVLLGAGAYVMLRGLALEVPGACFGTLLLAFEPFMMAGHYHPPRIACFAWVPWMVAAFVRTVEGRGLGATLGLAVAAALQATAGYPEYSLDTALVLALFWPAAARRVRGARAALGGSALVVAAAALAAMLSAVQLVSLVETFRTSTRGGGELPFLAGQRFELATFGSGLRGWAAAVGVFAYLPALAWALVFVGLATPERPYRGALAAVWVLASIVFAPALRALPPFNLFRSFLCWGSIVVLPLAALAGAGFDRVLGGRLGAREAVAGTVALAALLPLLPARSLAWLAVALAVLLVSRIAPRPAIALLLLLTLADVWTFVPAPLPATLRHRYAAGQVPYPSLDAELRRADELRAACGAESDGRVLAPPETLAGLPVAGRLRAVQGYPEPLAPARMSRLLDGRRAYVRPPQGMAFLARETRRAESEDAALAAVLDPGFAPRQTVVLERADASVAPAACGEGCCTPGEVEPVAAEPGRIRFRVVAETASHLVVSADHSPGWRAHVDGRRAPVLRADYAFMAVPVAPGAHEVELWYRPRGLAPAVALSLAGLVLTAVGGLRCLSRSSWWRSSPRSPSSSSSST